MNRHNFLGHLALALTLILVAAFAGQIRRWQAEWRTGQQEVVVRRAELRTAEQTAENKAEVLVRFREGTALERIKRIAAELNDRLEDQIESVGGLVMIQDEDGLGTQNAEAVAAQYRELPEVEYAEPNFEIRLEPEPRAEYSSSSAFSYLDEELAAAAPNDPMFSEQWSLENNGQRGGKVKADINALRAWSKTQGSGKVVVAVLDSGVDYTHADLVNNIWVRPAGVAEYMDDHLGTVNDRYGFNAVDNIRDPMDDNGHGTHCAGIIGAEGGNGLGIVGVNWKVEIMPLKFMSAGGFGTTKDAIEAINYVIDRKRAGVNVRIISASWGSRQKSKALEDVIRKAGEEGILFIAASGNSSENADKSPHYPASYDLPNVISVAALNRNDELASFSNYGVKRVHIAAPGVEILSTWLGGVFREASGTSMATPEVSGVAALVLAADPDLSVKELRERLFKSVDKLDSLNGKVSTGGRINAAKAVEAE
ncbi:MAG TPA: S8 family serine peptidase [Pyrinomonadaceae bacterium]|nr:S8 family serine peptidase [Pyrinomonadaceae bacterium]